VTHADVDALHLQSLALSFKLVIIIYI